MPTESCYEIHGSNYCVCIMPIKSLLRQLPMEGSTSAILFSSYPKPKELPRDYLFLSIDDITNPSRPTAFTKKDASEIICFLRNTSSTSRMLVCCDGGVSRSAALVASLLFVANGNDDEIWGDAKYHPNPLIYSVMRSALACPCEDGELSRKIRKSEAALARKIQQKK